MLYHHYLPGYMDFPLDEDRPFTTVEELSGLPPVKNWLDRNEGAVLCLSLDRHARNGERRTLMVYMEKVNKFYVIGFISGPRYDINSLMLPMLDCEKRKVCAPACPDCVEASFGLCVKCFMS